MQAVDLVQAARFCRQTLAATSVSVQAGLSSGWPALLAGAAAPDRISSGCVQIPWSNLADDEQ
jgi:hypothetical protein